MGPGDEVITVSSAPKPFCAYISSRLADVTRARQMLGFTASVPLNEGVRELVAWWQAERAEQAMRRLAEPRAEVL